MKEALCFDDVLLVPRFSKVVSRKDVNLATLIAGQNLGLPIISSNMDTVTEASMAKAMNKAGGVGCLHRFMSIEDNIRMFKEAECKPWVSIGLGTKELERAEALFHAGATTFVIDVAHGANIEVVKQFNKLYTLTDEDTKIIVGNFASLGSIQDFKYHATDNPNAFKVGIGGGSACTTRIETGCGMPTFTSVLECSKQPVDIIADGGMRTPGDIAKALAAGAKAVMLGGMLAGTDETPGESTYDGMGGTFKKYRGSASKESYTLQGKDESWRTAEGASFNVRCKGSVAEVLQRIEGGLRSAYSYNGASNLAELQNNAEFIRISQSGYKEGTPHGKR